MSEQILKQTEILENVVQEVLARTFIKNVLEGEIALFRICRTWFRGERV